jgi:hypothetical protein
MAPLRCCWIFEILRLEGGGREERVEVRHGYSSPN